MNLENFRSAPGESPWLSRIRSAASERFRLQGFPTAKNEDWKYSSTSALARAGFGFPEPMAAAAPIPMQSWGEKQRLVFVDGRVSMELSRFPAELTVLELDKAQTDEKFRGLFEEFEKLNQDQPFFSLNSAALMDGIFIQAKPGFTSLEPLHLIYCTTPASARKMNAARTLVVADRGAELRLVERFEGESEVACFNNFVTEIWLEDDAKVQSSRFQREPAGVFHNGYLTARLGRGSRLANHLFATGASWARSEIRVQLQGEGAEAELYGVYAATGHQHLDCLSVIDHAVPRCRSAEVYKGILGGTSRGIFQGKVLVRKDAQKTDASQSSRALLLSPLATANGKPQLEIYADDVKCSHGAAVGKLDPAALFYLRSRGIGARDAQRLLTEAYAAEVVERLDAEHGLRAKAQRLFADWMAHAGV